MSETQVQHESLLLPGYWRITSFGKLTDNPFSARSDLRIRISLAPLIDPEIVSPELGLLDGQIRHLLIPVGELPRLYFNAILYNGRLCSHQIHRIDLENRVTRKLDCAHSNIRVFKRFDCDEFGDPIIPVRSKWSDQLGDPEMHGYFVAIGSASDPYATIVPAIEIFRFFYATSDVLAKELLRDSFLDPGERLWNPAKTAIGSDGRAVLWLRKYMLDADARFLARFAFDNYALQQAQEIFLHASITGLQEGERMIRAIPPFQDTVSTQFLCCPIGGPDGKRVVVTRFLQCDWKPPFSHLKWDRDNDGRYDPDNREERDPTDWSPGLLTVPDGENPKPTKLSEKPPSAANVPSRLREEEICERFPELYRVPADKLPQENTTTRADHPEWRPVMKEAYTGSVVDGQSSGEVVGKTIIEGLEKRPEPQKEHTDAVDTSVGLTGYQLVLKLLQDIGQQSLAHVKFLAVLDSTTHALGIDFNVYPKEIDGKEKAWLYVDRGKKYSRMALLAEVVFEGRTRYVIELQQKREKECSTLVAWNNAESSLPNGLLRVLVLDCARAESATLRSAQYLRVRWARLHHSSKGRRSLDAKHYLERIMTTAPEAV